MTIDFKVSGFGWIFGKQDFVRVCLCVEENVSSIGSNDVKASIAVGGNCYLFSAIFFRHTNELRNYSLVTQQRKFFICSMEYGLLLEAARLVVFRLVGCLRRNGLAGY